MAGGDERRHGPAVVEELGAPRGLEARFGDGREHVASDEAHRLDDVAEGELLGEQAGYASIFQFFLEELAIVAVLLFPPWLGGL